MVKTWGKKRKEEQEKEGILILFLGPHESPSLSKHLANCFCNTHLPLHLPLAPKIPIGNWSSHSQPRWGDPNLMPWLLMSGTPLPQCWYMHCFRPIRFKKCVCGRGCVYGVWCVSGESSTSEKTTKQKTYAGAIIRKAICSSEQGGGQMGDPEPLWSIATAMIGAKPRPRPAHRVSTEEHAVLNELHRKGAEALMKSWTCRTNHKYEASQTYPWTFNLHEPISLYFALADLCGVPAYLQLKIPNRQSSRTKRKMDHVGSSLTSLSETISHRSLSFSSSAQTSCYPKVSILIPHPNLH